MAVAFGKRPAATSHFLHSSRKVCNRGKCSRLQFFDLRGDSGQHVLDYTAV